LAILSDQTPHQFLRKKPVNKYKLSVFALAVVALSGCTSTPEFQSGPDAEVTHDGLTRLDKTVMDAVWARTDIDLSSYDKIMLEGIGIEYRPVTGPYSGRAGTSSMRRSTDTEFQLDDKTKALVREEITGAFVDELSRISSFKIVDQPGPDVLTVRVGLLDVVSMVPPDSVGRVSVYLDRVGEATLVLELRDSTSNAILARAVDRRAAERGAGNMVESNKVTNRSEVRRLGRTWAGIVRRGLETLMAAE
jgi:hypothetical protein